MVRNQYANTPNAVRQLSSAGGGVPRKRDGGGPYCRIELK